MGVWEFIEKKNREDGWIFFKPSDFYEFMEEKEAKIELNYLAGQGKIRKRVTEGMILVEMVE
jgi:hypothetical protein